MKRRTQRSRSTSEVVDRDTALNQAALQLLAAEPDHAERGEAVRGLLAPLASSNSEPEWVREAVTSAIEIVDQALAGELAWDGAFVRVGTLIELVMAGTPAPVAESGAAPEGAVPHDTLRELVPDFIAESLEYLGHAEAALLALERDPADDDAVNTLFRAFHTVKSTAAFLGLDPISSLAHSAESLLSPVRDGRADFDAGVADAILACIDLMRDLVEQVRSSMGSAGVSLATSCTAVLEQLAAEERRLAAPQRVARQAVLSDQHVAAASREAAPTTAPLAADPAPHRRADDGSESGVRVQTARLDQLMDLVGELVVAQSMVMQDELVAGQPHGALGGKVAHTARVVRELQDLAMSLRMVPLRPLFRRMQRLVRDLAKESGKQVDLVTEGEETEIDRHMVDFLATPLVHMIRNAVDHGLESSADRAAAGKPAAGTLRLAARHAGGAVVVQLHDDGRGLDHAKILSRAVASGLVARDASVTAGEIDDLIFSPGLSTADEVTSISGRGVGMDVVRTNVEALHGRVEVDSQPGAGTTFTLRLPLTLAITDGMLVRVGAERYILPTVHIQTCFRPDADALMRVAGGGELVVLHGDAVPLVRLHAIFGIANAVVDAAHGILTIIGDAPRRYALLVDELLGQQQFVAKAVGTGLGSVPGVAGAAVLGDGHVGLILDPPAIVALAAKSVRAPIVRTAAPIQH